MVKDNENDNATRNLSMTRPAGEKTATIGPSISIKGEVSGSEDLLIQGNIEGTVDLKENTVTVGTGARVKANVFGRVIHVEGEVVGDLRGREQVVVHKSGYVKGNITAPRLSLEDGARLKGSIDTEPEGTETMPALQVEKARTTTSTVEDVTPRGARKNGLNPTRDNSGTPVV